MKQKQDHVAVRMSVVTMVAMINIIIISAAYRMGDGMYWALLITLPLLFFAIKNTRNKTTCRCSQCISSQLN